MHRHRYLLERTQEIAAPRDEVFAFFAGPDNLGAITPGWLRFELRRIDKLPFGVGTKIEYRIRPFGVPQRWVARIVSHMPPLRFVDVQEEGPYASWRHLHEFDELDGGRTLMRDRVEYALPFGLLGRAAHALLVGRQLREIFGYRAEVIGRLFPAVAPLRDTG